MVYFPLAIEVHLSEGETYVKNQINDANDKALAYPCALIKLCNRGVDRWLINAFTPKRLESLTEAKEGREDTC